MQTLSPELAAAASKVVQMMTEKPGTRIDTATDLVLEQSQEIGPDQKFEIIRLAGHAVRKLNLD